MVQTTETGNHSTEKSPLPLMGTDQIKEFDSVYSNIINELIEENNKIMPGMEAHNRWLQHLLDYNVCGGKKLRGLMVTATYKCLVKEPTSENILRANVLGWIVEVLQGSSLVADDIMDESETRRGKSCWYKREDVGMSAVVHTRLIENISFRLLKIYFGNTPYFNQLWDCVLEVLQKTVFGQSLDFMTSKSDDVQESFTIARYNALVKYKTSYYTMYFPVALAMILAGKGDDRNAMKRAKSVLLEIGHYFQVQDDYLDCFGDEQETGKVGTDIQDNKCSWLVVQAFALCNPLQLQLLLQNYGKCDPKNVEEVKGLYRDLNLQRAYADYELEMKNRIVDKIMELPKDVGEEVFREIFLKIYQRKK